jgi:shikimate kinase
MGADAVPVKCGCMSWSAMGARAVFLVGFMASGKSCVGLELARRARWDFVDLDARIEARERQTIPEIFRASGEVGFRIAETAALYELTQSLERDSVVALGGGAFAQDKNRELLRPWPSVFLQAPVDELWQRSADDKEIRPLRKDREQFARLYAERLPFYRRATLIVETSGKDPAAICVEIETALQLGQAKTGSTPDTSRSSETGGSR